MKTTSHDTLRSYCLVPLLLCLFFAAGSVGVAQGVDDGEKGERGVKGDKPSGRIQSDEDTLYVFESPRSLLSALSASKTGQVSYGGRVVISGSGYGVGFYYERDISARASLFADLLISGARNTSELEMQDPNTYIVFVPNKIHRIMIFPLSLGCSYRFLDESTVDNMRPSVSAGVGPTYVASGPYDAVHIDFFQSMAQAETYLRWGGFIGASLTVRNTEKSYVSIDARYYVIPFGGNGIESIRGKPMLDFNGLFLSLSLGFH